MPICTRCNQPKSEDDFFFRNKQTGKLRQDCKECCRKFRHSSEHYQKYKSEYRARTKARNERIFKENIKHLLEFFKIHPCLICGESNPIFLDFDHRDPTTKKGNISSWIRWQTWSKIFDEISKCDVLCVKCHRLKTANQFGYWKIFTC